MKSSRWLFFVYCLTVCISGACMVSVGQAQTIRSHRFNGYVRFAHQPQFDASLQITIEAWIYRETPFLTGRQAIVSHDTDFYSSYFFGLDGDNNSANLVFKRGGSSTAASTGTISNYNWTHVAVTYDGNTARFFIDGIGAGTVSLTNNGYNVNRPLLIGARALSTSTNPSITEPFKGYIDEVRIWSVKRTTSQIQNARFHEPRSISSLAAVFPTGGPFEELSGVTGSSWGTASPQVFGILPRDLLIPKTLTQPCIDGNMNTYGEYAGAEQLVIRYRDPVTQNQKDAIAYLVHTDNDLYIGIKNTYYDVGSTAWTAILLDPLGSNNPRAESTDVHIMAPNNGAQPIWLVGDGNGNYVAPGSAVNECGAAPCASAGCSTWQHASAFCQTEFEGLCHEFRIPKNRLGTFLEEDSLAIGHFWVDGNSGFDHFGPGDAFWNQPATWARVSYSENFADVPRVTVYGHVYDRASSSPMANYPVDLFAGNSLTAQTQTTNLGFFQFSDVFVSASSQLRVQVANCSGCTCVALEPDIGVGMPRPLSAYPYYVVFQACSLDNSPCIYPSVDFRMRPDSGSITIASASTDEGHGRVILSDPVTYTSWWGGHTGRPAKEIPPSEVTLTGTGFSDCMTVWFVKEGWVLFPGYAEKIKAKIKIASDDGTSAVVIVPEVPDTWPAPSNGWSYNGYWAIHDHTAGGSGEASSYVWGPPFRILEVSTNDYAKIYGFPFKNTDDHHGWRTFTSVYGDNAYVNALICDIPDPLYVIWFPIYLAIMNGEAVCSGMASTSLQMYHDRLSPDQFSSAAHYPAGLWGKGAAGTYAPKPDHYSDFNLCGPYHPKNLWSYILTGKGAIASHQSLQAIWQDMEIGGFSIDGDPMARFNELKNNNPLDQVLCFVPSVANSHCVVAYRVEDLDPLDPSPRNKIYIWDNNYPEVEQIVEINPSNNTYLYDPTGENIYSGTGLYTIPYSVWTGPRNAPGLVELLDVIYVLVYGAADVLLLGNLDNSAQGPRAGGGTWGWDANGNFVDAFPGLVALPIPNGGSSASGAPVPVAVSMAVGPPSAQINCRGETYGFAAAQGGTMIRLDAWGTAAGEVDNADVGYTASKLNALVWTPSAPRDGVLPLIGMHLPGDRRSAVFKWSGLQVTPAQEVGFTAKPADRGVAYRNGTDGPTSHMLIVDMVDGPSGNAATLIFGPFDVPAGATHITRLESWPTIGTIRVEMDLNSDDSIDQSSIVSGRVLPWPPALPPADIDLNGIEDSLDQRCDMDVDEDVDLPDWAIMYACLTGPITTVSGQPCERGDVNFDLHLDMADVIRFQQTYTGPKGDHSCCTPGSAGCDDTEIQSCVCAQDPTCCENWSANCVLLVEILECGECPSDHDCCSIGMAGCNNPLIEECVCEIDAFCCQNNWDSQCVAEVESLECGNCGTYVPDCCAVGGPGCLDPVVQDCVCEFDPYCCQFAWDDACVKEVESLSCGTCPQQHHCCETGGPGCNDPAVATCICDSMPFCCQGAWDSQCADGVNTSGCGVCTAASQDCCSTNANAPGCNDTSVENCVCAVDAYCCTTTWDDLCVDLVDDLGCGICGTEHACCSLGGPGCADPIVEACVCDLNPNCCDEIWDGTCVEAVEDLACGTCGYSTHSCCETGAAGCVDLDVAACVCARDSYCCNTSWDGICVSEVETFGCALCNTHDCCETGGTGCSNEFIMQCVCSLDSYCCGTAWNSNCVNEVESFECGTCP